MNRYNKHATSKCPKTEHPHIPNPFFGEPFSKRYTSKTSIPITKSNVLCKSFQQIKAQNKEKSCSGLFNPLCIYLSVKKATTPVEQIWRNVLLLALLVSSSAFPQKHRTHIALLGGPFFSAARGYRGD